MNIGRITARYKNKVLENKIFDPIRNKYVKLTPEEAVRQKIIKFLMKRLQVPQDKILVERALGTLGLLVAEDKKKQRIDIGILDEEGLLMAVVECKASLLSNTEAAFTEAQNYLLSLNTRYYFVTDGSTFDGYYFDTNQFVKLEEIPTYNNWYYYPIAKDE